MKPGKTARVVQQTPAEVLEALLGLVQRKFYAGDAVNFAKDRKRILQWCLLWPAREWFKPKSISLPAARYQEILTKVIMEATIHQAEKINYIPAWLARVIQSHFEMHGDEIYEEGKAVRNVTENALLALGKLPVREDVLVNDFAAASHLLDAAKPARRKQTPKTDNQLNLLPP
ncbi:MAG: hypothetical protein HOP33_19120 [Verrucomicrobia bacterium]|nr:hypothetical protein [Verrucomicrobiota bacterium]